MNNSAITALRVLRQVLVELPVAENLMCWLRAPRGCGFAWESEYNPIGLLGNNVYSPAEFDKDWRTMLMKFDLSPIEDWKGWLKQVLVKHEIHNDGSSYVGCKTPSETLKRMVYSSGKAALKGKLRPEFDCDSLPGSASSVSISGLALTAAMLIEPATVLIRLDCGSGRGLVAMVFDVEDGNRYRDRAAVVNHLMVQGMSTGETQDMWLNDVSHTTSFVMTLDSDQIRGYTYTPDQVTRNMGNVPFRLAELAQVVDKRPHDNWLGMVEQLKSGEHVICPEVSIRSCMESWEARGVPAWELMKIDV